MRRPALLRLAALACAALSGAGCLQPQDDPSTVDDLRVIAIAIERPEIFSPTCDARALPVLAQRVVYTALIADPAGGGRALRYELWACSDPADRTCGERADRVLVARGETRAGELAVPMRPGLLLLEDGTPLLQRVIQKDPFGGLGGGRMPLVLHLFAGEEAIYAQKLMVFGCAFFPQMRANQTPLLPGAGLNLGGEAWPAGTPREVSGRGGAVVEPVDFSALQEPYIVPSFELQPVHLEERWRLAYYADVGTFSPHETGGTNAAGEDARHRTTWRPPPEDAAAAEVNVWVVVRDGRGGVSWVHRTLRWTP